MTRSPMLRLMRHIKALVMVILAWFFFLSPGWTSFRVINDPGTRSDRIPDAAFTWHRSLTPKYAAWARARVGSGKATQLSLHDISGTEWPIFGSVFYLWATESLQEAWEKGQRKTDDPPIEYAKDAIDASIRLIADPNHANWVKRHWGNDYLHQENVFYRTLLIGGMTSHLRLTGDRRYEHILRDQVESLAKELDASPHGLLDDYPGECYPTDILAAVAVIRKADEVLGTDHSDFARRAFRAFEGPLLDPSGLPPYGADSRTGRIIGRSRGCGNSFMLIKLPDLWPELAPEWYGKYETHFWQRRWTADGFREFPRDEPNSEWYADVDSGPVIAGHGIAACAFGVGAARANGRWDHAYPLTVEMILVSWPLPDGTLLGPRILSNATDAPYLGEAGVLYAMTRRPNEHVRAVPSGSLPPFVWIVLALYLGTGLLLLLFTWRRWKNWTQRMSSRRTPFPGVQTAIGAILLSVGVTMLFAGKPWIALLLILLNQLFPLTRRYRNIKETEPAFQG